jgi:predicted nucleic acid-binding protein
MIASLDTSILIAALLEGDPHYAACDALIAEKDVCIYLHGLVEAFNTLTGGRLGFRLLPKDAAEIIEGTAFPTLGVITLTAKETMAAMGEAHSRGVRGGAIYDYLHLVAARKAKSRRLYTLDVSNFRSFHRPGDPEVVHP